MKSKIAWTILSNVLGSARASGVVVFFDALLHFREYCAEAMEYRVQCFSHFCFHCGAPYAVTALFCPNCGQKILSPEEQNALVQADMAAWKAEEDAKVAAEEAAAWEEWRAERLEMVYH